MKKQVLIILNCFLSIYALTEKEEKERELSNMICEENKEIQFIKFEDILEEVDYMKKKNRSWELNQESELKNFHSTMNSYIKENKGAVFVDESGKKYTINDVKIMYSKNIFYKYIIRAIIIYQVVTWSYYKIKGLFFDDEKRISNKYDNKKNEKDDQNRENI